jgi:hypothetical protein
MSRRSPIARRAWICVRTKTAPWTSIAVRKRRLALRGTGSLRFLAGTGSRISASISQPRTTSIGRGPYRTSSRFRPTRTRKHPLNSPSCFQKLQTGSHAMAMAIAGVFSESRMRQIRTSGSMSGCGNRSMAELVRHRQTKESATDRLHLNHRATPRLHTIGVVQEPSYAIRRIGTLRPKISAPTRVPCEPECIQGGTLAECLCVPFSLPSSAQL